MNELGRFNQNKNSDAHKVNTQEMHALYRSKTRRLHRKLHELSINGLNE